MSPARRTQGTLAGLRQRLGAAAPGLPLLAACLLMIAFGVWLRGQKLEFPELLTWDEHHFVMNARNYLAGRPDTNDHPPLGKLLIALPMHLMGDTAQAWRLAPFLLGCGSVACVGLLAAWSSQRKTAFWLGASLAAVDGFLVAYSRCALLDGMLACLCLAAIWTGLRSKSSLGMAAAAVLLGSACSVKYSGVVFLPVLLWIALSRRSALSFLLALVLAPATYVAWYSLGLWMAHQPFGVSAVIAETKRLYLHHASLTDWKHPLVSHWYEWLVPTRPLPIRKDVLSDGRVRMLTSLGNPLLWWLVDLALVVSAASLARAAVAAFRGRGWRGLVSTLMNVDGAPGRQLVLLALWCAPIAPWLVSRRDSYVYHYLLAYVFGLALTATLLEKLRQERQTLALLTLLVVAQVSFFYAPVWGQLPLSQEGVERRLFLERWR